MYLDGDSSVLGRAGGEDYSRAGDWTEVCLLGEYVAGGGACGYGVFGVLFCVPGGVCADVACGAGEVAGAIAGCVCDDHLYGGWDACLGALYRWRCGYFGPYGADGAGEHVELEHGIWSSIDCWGVWNWLSGAV